jgi:predicted RNA binding protein YcfA (HicA-like mRNA interferase family)
LYPRSISTSKYGRKKNKKNRESNVKSFKQIASTVRGEDVLEEGLKPDHKMRPGWMLKADPKLGKAVKDKIDLAKKRQATYGDKSAGKSVKEETIEEAGLWANIHAKRERIKSGSGERMRKPGSEGAPSEKVLKKTQAVSEEKKDKYDEGEYDREGDMAKSDLRSIIANAQKMHDMIDDADNLPEWVQSKITIAEDYISTVANYMTAEMNEEVEQLDEMPGANMDTRAVHQHLKKKGWSLTRTSGGHDVFTHPEAKHHIPVPRHRQLKAPLVKGILKQSEVREEFVAEDKDYDDRMKKALDRAKNATPRKPTDEYERKVVKHLKKKHGMKEEVGQMSNSNENPNAGRFTSGPAKKPAKPTPIVTSEQTAMSKVKHLAKTAARKQAGLKEEQEPEDSFEKTSTPAKRSLSKTAGIVKDLAKNSKSSKKEKDDAFQAEPELSSQIIKT